MLAAEGGHLQIVKLLVSKMATVEARGKMRSQHSLLSVYIILTTIM